MSRRQLSLPLTTCLAGSKRDNISHRACGVKSVKPKDTSAGQLLSGLQIEVNAIQKHGPRILTHQRQYLKSLFSDVSGWYTKPTSTSTGTRSCLWLYMRPFKPIFYHCNCCDMNAVVVPSQSGTLSFVADAAEELFDDVDQMSDEFRDRVSEMVERFSDSFAVQSGNLVINPMHDDSKSDHINAENVQFLDESRGQVNAASGSYDTPMDATPAVDLGDFLKRPVKISTITWNESDAIGTKTTIKPWKLFFNNAFVKYKLNNYAFLAAKLHVKIVINASPFYYGAMLAAYQPLQVYTPSTIVNGAGTGYLIPYSQRPHVWIYPQNSEGGEMTLPFFYPKNWLRVQVAQDFDDMGQIDFINYTKLDSANDASGVGVTIQVFAWAEDVVLSGPSVGLALQGPQDEYVGTVSAPASAVATVAGRLKDLPIIGKFATATQLGASAIAKIASLFGFSNVPVVEDVKPFRSSPFPQLASPEISFPVEKLTLDPKNELTVDPTTLGLPPHNELAVSYIAQKESYIATATWASTNASDDILFSSVVTPVIYSHEALSTGSLIQSTPVNMLAQLFNHWRGDLVFRFRFICSQYHKGRARISWDPAGYSGANVISTTDATTVTQTAIIDLGKDTDVEFRVPYHQALPWLRCIQSATAGNVPFSTSASPTFNYNEQYHNGTLVLRVNTVLTGPTATPSIKVLVSVRGAENLEFANPAMNYGEERSTFALQSGQDTIIGEEPTQIVAGKTRMPNPERYLLNFGENVSDLRILLRRSAFSNTWGMTSNTTNDYIYWRYYFSKMPPAPGYDPTGIHSAKGLVVTGSNFPYNFVHMTHLNWLAPAFVGMRGSVMNHFNVVSQSDIGTVRVDRNNTFGNTNQVTVTPINKGTTSEEARNYRNTVQVGIGGIALTNQGTQSGLSVQCPNYNAFKFQPTTPGNITSAPTADQERTDTYSLTIVGMGTSAAPSGKNTYVERYVSIGTDFSLHYFLNAPSFYVYPSIPGI